MNQTGEEIRRAREAQGLSRRDVEIATGVSERTIIRVERGQSTSERSLQPLMRYFKLGEFADDPGPRLLDASHAELVAELARRLGTISPPINRLVPIPPTEIEWPMTAAPSQQNRAEDDDLPDADTPRT